METATATAKGTRKLITDVSVEENNTDGSVTAKVEAMDFNLVGTLINTAFTLPVNSRSLVFQALLGAITSSNPGLKKSKAAELAQTVLAAQDTTEALKLYSEGITQEIFNPKNWDKDDLISLKTLLINLSDTNQAAKGLLEKAKQASISSSPGVRGDKKTEDVVSFLTDPHSTSELKEFIGLSMESAKAWLRLRLPKEGYAVLRKNSKNEYKPYFPKELRDASDTFLEDSYQIGSKLDSTPA